MRRTSEEEAKQLLRDRAERFLTELDAVLPSALKVTKAMWQVPTELHRGTNLVLLIPRAGHSWREDQKVIYKYIKEVLDNIDPPIVEFRAGDVACTRSEGDFNRYEVYCSVLD